MYRKILIPADLDDPDTMRKAFEAAKELLKVSLGAHIRIINVQPIVPVSILNYLPPHFDEATSEAAKKKLSTTTSQWRLPENRISKTIRNGTVYDEVLAEANDWGADIIIVGSHKPSMSKYLLGSNAAVITRHAKCSVLVVR